MRTVRRGCGGGAAGLENLLALVVDDDHFASIDGDHFEAPALLAMRDWVLVSATVRVS
jgi:hypothetical protein